MTVDTIEQGGEVVSLGEAAESWGPDDDGSEQPALVPEGAKVTFVGVNYQDIEETLELGDEVAFVVKGRVCEKGVRIAKTDGNKHPFAKVDVLSVTPA